MSQNKKKYLGVVGVGSGVGHRQQPPPDILIVMYTIYLKLINNINLGAEFTVASRGPLRKNARDIA